MNFDQIASNSRVFLDANSLIYHFTADSAYGAACTRLVERVELGDIQGFSSADVISDTAHRLMTIEAMNQFGWPITGLAARLRRHHSEIAKLARFQQAIDQIPRLGIVVFEVSLASVLAATKLSQQYELLSGDALVVAAMQSHGIVNLASNDADFDRVPTLTRYAAV